MKMESKDEHILNTSDAAAKHVTGIDGWVDRHGRFWGKDESAARWSGCTHIICPDCSNPTSKNYTICSACRDKKAIERYNKRDRIEWDTKTPLYSYAADEYFFDEDELDCYIEDNDCSIESLRLVICDPVKLRNIHDDYWEDELQEDGELPKDILQALEELNELINSYPAVSWYPGKSAAKISKSK
jgi:hypothetical protein